MSGPEHHAPTSRLRSHRPFAIVLVALAVALGTAGAWTSLRSDDRDESDLNAAEAVAYQAGDRVEEALRWLDRRANAAADELSRVIEENQPRVLLAQASERLNHRLGGFVYRPGDRGENWQAFEPALINNERSTVLLVHGLDEPGDIWDELAPALANEGHRVLRFNYPNDQNPEESADQLAAFLQGPLSKSGLNQLSIVCHSMGGLVTRDLLTRQYAKSDWSGPVVERFITVGTPNHGSPVAALQPVGEARELIARLWTSRTLNPSEMLGILIDGSGEAASALAEGSAYLEDLNARPLPEGVRITIIAADASAEQRAALRDLAASAPVAGIMGEQARNQLLAQVERITNTVGDGVVPVTSTPLEGVEDYVLLTANHRSMLRTIPLFSSGNAVPPAIPVITDRLADQLKPAPEEPGTPAQPSR